MQFISTDHSNGTEMLQNPPQNPNPVPNDPYSHHLIHLHTTHYPFHYPHQPPNPNPNPSLPIDPNPNPSLPVDPNPNPILPVDPNPNPILPVDPNPNPSLPVDPNPNPSLPIDPNPNPSLPIDPNPSPSLHQLSFGVTYAQHQTVDAGTVVVPSADYQDPSVVASLQNWALQELIRQYGANMYATGVTIPTAGTEQLVPVHQNYTQWTSTTAQPHKNGIWNKGPKKTKIVQSAWCEVCKLDCNSKGVLEQHKLGKKHKKHLEKLREASAPTPGASAVSNNPVIGPQENPGNGKVIGGQKTKAAAEPEDVETKRRKVLEGGAAAYAVRTCMLCNVVCNSEIVYRYHLGGQKHASMVKKQAAGTGLATAT